MPELPEVETTLRGISPHIAQQTITKIIVRQPSLRWPVDPNTTTLQGAQITQLIRRAKYIIMGTNKGSLIWHLGMSGSMRILLQDSPAEKHDHIDVILNNGCILRYNDPRRFGACIFTTSDPLQHKLLSKLGPEPLHDDFNGDYLYAISRGKNTAIKSFIMDSHIVCGVGNIYACESLFHSQIHPTRKAGKIAKQRYINLANQIKDILSRSIQQGGTTLKDFTQSDGKPGYFKQQLSVYGRKGLACPVCQQAIKNIKQAQRSTFFCSECQH